MTHGGSGNPTDLTVYNAIHALIEGKSATEVANETGWDLEDVMSVHPESISRTRLIEIADEQHWPQSYAEELIKEIQLYLIERNDKELQIKEAKRDDPRREEEPIAQIENDEIIPFISMTHSEWHGVLQRGVEQMKAQREWQQTVAQCLSNLVLPVERTTIRQQLLEALRSDLPTDERFAIAVKTMIELIPLALDRTLGVKGHLLSSVSSEYPMEYDLLRRAIKDAMQA